MSNAPQMKRLDPEARLRESASRLPEPVVLGKDSKPLAGQQGLDLEGAGYVRDAPEYGNLRGLMDRTGTLRNRLGN